MKYVSVKQVASYVKDHFKIEMDIYDVVRNCAEALKLLKMYALGEELTFTTIKDFCVKLPGVYDVRSVIRLEAPALTTTIVLQDIAFPPQIVFEMPQEEDEMVTITYKDNYIPQLKGPYMDFVWNCPHLEFNEDKVWIAIHTLAIKKDAEGYPMVPEITFYACAYYCMYSYHWPLFLLGKVEPFVWNEIKLQKDIKFGQARADKTLQALNNNQADKLFNIMVSMDRKAYNFPM